MPPGEQTLTLDEDKIDVVAIVRLLWGYKYLIILTTVLFGGIALFLGYTAKPVYRAEATVTEVNSNNMGGAASLANQFGGLAGLIGVNLGNMGGAGREAQALLKSRRLVEEFIVRNKLIPVLYPKAVKPPTLWIAVRKFRNDVVAIRDEKKSGMTVVAVNWTDAAIASRWANEFVALANELLRARAVAESNASIAYLNKQIVQTNVVEIQNVMYNLIESETKTLMLANARAEYAFSVVDPAVAPEVRISPRRRLMFMLGVAFGGILGVAFALAHNLWRRHGREILRTL